MKTADEHLGSVDKSIERAQRNAFLNSKGIKPNSQFQLDLIFPDTIGDRDDLRHIPNDYARSSIFTARNKREPRRTLMHEKLFHLFLVSRDLAYFAHEHPTLEPDGRFRFETEFPKPGMYRVLSDFYPSGRVTSLLVVDENERLIGAVNSNDLMRAKVI